ncbi:MAG: ribonuclease domain-containing protein [Syntrophomonas sp.]|nr:ribonuclease domain-containing protein [Syntrophomonas sp.]
MKSKIIAWLLLLVLALTAIGCTSPDKPETISQSGKNEIVKIDKKGAYSKPMEVAEYIHTYNQLPKNYITKKEAAASGWESNKGNLWEVTDQKSIGGDVFQNREGKLPKAKGRQWYECDVNYYGGYRGEERLIFSNDGLIYYTQDHYETFTEITFAKR